MLFNSVQFVLFFPLVVALYFAIPYRFRWMMLLAASYYFYMCWKPEYLILILVSTFIDYLAGLGMADARTRQRRILFLILSLCSNLGLLFAFKYFNFFSESTRALFDRLNILHMVPRLDVLLPVGISFYTFQTLSYTIDVYRGQRDAERHLGIFALYVAFFPQLVAGPIERSTHLLPQFRVHHGFDADRVSAGLRLMLWGMFKKVVIADRLAVFVDQVYGNPSQMQVAVDFDKYSGLPIILATYFFAFQIYCDFSGYSDIAIGAARVMGYDLMKNFNRPYFAKSIHEFWQRWHISLSTWFRDYFYISLGGNRVPKRRWYFNLFITFLVSGLWHGANWTFVFWGALHGTYLMLGIATKRFRERAARALGVESHPVLLRWIRVLWTFHLVLLSWVFFRARSLGEAFGMLRHAFVFKGSPIVFDGGLDGYELSFAIFCILALLIIQLAQRRVEIGIWVARRPIWFRWACYCGLTWAILLLSGGTGNFIYFQF